MDCEKKIKMISYVILLLVSVTVCYAGNPKLMAECADELSITNTEGKIKILFVILLMSHEFFF